MTMDMWWQPPTAARIRKTLRHSLEAPDRNFLIGLLAQFLRAVLQPPYRIRPTGKR
jgi:hypothetical protein